MFMSCRPKFVAMAYSILRNTEDAEDAVQNAYISGYLHLRSWIRWTSMVVRRCPGGAGTRRLGTFTIVKEFQNHVVELYEADVQSLLPSTQVWDSDCRGIH